MDFVERDAIVRIDYPWTPRVARWRSVRIVIDGKRVGSVKNGGSADLHVPPGDHSVQVRMDWCKSPVVNVAVQAGEIVSLRATTVTADNFKEARRLAGETMLHPSRFLKLTIY